jgi:hypothetical protein
MFIGFSQPTCIDKSLCSSPPFNPICGTALPPCSTRNVASNKIATTEQPLPTLPSLTTSETKQPYYGFKMGAPQLNMPPPREQSLQPMNSKANCIFIIFVRIWISTFFIN